MFDSFSDLRTNINCDFYVDGEDYYRELVGAMQSAKQEILIADWFLAPEIYLTRGADEPHWRLDQLLYKKVTIFYNL